MDAEHGLRVQLVAALRERDDFKALNERSLERLHEAQEALAAARRECDLLRSALSDVVKLIDEGVLVRNIIDDGKPGWALRSVDLVLALKNAAALASPAASEEEKR